jgi:hypothetical protein
MAEVRAGLKIAENLQFPKRFDSIWVSDAWAEMF